VDGRDLARLERDSILNGSYAALTLNILSTFAPLLLLDALHGNRQQVALLNSLPALVSIGSFLLAAVWLTRTASQRRFVLGSAAAARLLVVLLALVPMAPPGLAAWAMVAVYAAINIPTSLANVGWQTLMASLIPPDRRAGFFAERNRITSIAGMGITVIAGLALQLFPPSDRLPYEVAFMSCAVFAAFELYYLARHPDVPPPPPTNLWKGWRDNWSHRPFRRYLVVAAVFTFAWQSAWPLYTIFQIRDAHATAFWLALFSVASALTSILTYHWWGRESTRRGIAPMLLVAAVGLGLSPALTVLLTNLDWLVFTNLFTGIFLSGVTLLMFNQLLEVAPEAQRLSMIPLYNLGIGIVGAIAPELGIFALHLWHMRTAMVVLSGLRVATGLGFLLVADRAAWHRAFGVRQHVAGSAR
jgi:MFS family permease